ncbi:MAG TPA: 2,3-diaminopropionate biosynthesis protein SbnB [Pyrinomonadaceae bacterium]
MRDDGILILRGGEVRAALDGRESEIIETVRAAYVAHGAGESALPQSLFLRFPGEGRERIIALPAYLGGGFEVAGVKWVSSFPNNIERGLNRASAVIILNSSETGMPEAILEGSVISAKRTAASAALAARYLHEETGGTTGVVGCGLINAEVVRFLLAARPDANEFVIFDLNAARAHQFAQHCCGLRNGLEVRVASSVEEVLSVASLVSIATTAVTPHLADLSACAPGTTVLHVSLRDLTPEVILSCDNVVDDVDHVCRAQTSVHLAEQLVNSRDFIRCTLADVLAGRAAARRESGGVTVFSPFGLGVLDVAVSKLMCELGARHKFGTVIDSFSPPFWG